MEEKYLLKCIDCGLGFFTEGERDFYRRKGLYTPKRCKDCRTKRNKVYKERDRHRKVDLYLAKFPFEEVDKKDLALLEGSSSLFIIGNGFDLIHDIPSSYYHFRDSLGKNNNIRRNLENFVQADNLWGDFESNLAYLNRESMLATIDTWFDIFDVLEEDDEDFSVSDYFAAQEAATDPVYVLTYELPKGFRSWIESLKYSGQVKPLLEVIDNDARYINFNYTEFLESIYGINKENILYIHGDRRNKNQELVLGHGHDVDTLFERWHESNKDRREYQPIISKGKAKYDKNDNPVYLAYFLKDETMGNWKSQVRYDAINNMIGTIEAYYEDSGKKTQEVFNRNKDYFKSLSNVKNIVVIGHSLSDVDLPYFKEIWKNNIDRGNLKWYFSLYNESSLDKIYKLALELEIDSRNIRVFKL